MNEGISGLSGAYNDYMSSRQFSPRTIEARAMFVRARLRDWQTFEVSSAKLAQWLAQFAGHTRRTYHDHLQAFYSFLVTSGRLRYNPMDEIPRPPTPRPMPRPLSQDDARRSLFAAEGDLRAYLLLGRYAGLRAFEVAKFSGEDIDAENLYVFGKGAKAEVLPTHPELWELAASYPKRGFWFPSERSAAGHVTAHSVTMRVSRLFDRLQIDGSSHRNRHYYGTELLRRGANIRVVQELMRHSDISTTIRYLGVDQAEKIAAIRALSA